jgi:hypothetical protein
LCHISSRHPGQIQNVRGGLQVSREKTGLKTDSGLSPLSLLRTTDAQPWVSACWKTCWASCTRFEMQNPCRSGNGPFRNGSLSLWNTLSFHRPSPIQNGEVIHLRGVTHRHSKTLAHIRITAQIEYERWTLMPRERPSLADFHWGDSRLNWWAPIIARKWARGWRQSSNTHIARHLARHSRRFGMRPV